MQDLSITAYGEAAFGEISGLDGLDLDGEFRGGEVSAGVTRVYRVSNSAWERLRPKLRELSQRRVQNVDGSGNIIIGSFKPLMTYSLTPTPDNHPRITLIEETEPLSVLSDGVLTVTGVNLLGATKAYLDIYSQSPSPIIGGTTGTTRFASPVRIMRVLATMFGARGKQIYFRVAPAGSASVVVRLVGESRVEITVTPASGSETVAHIAAQVVASTVASYYITITQYVAGARVPVSSPPAGGLGTSPQAAPATHLPLDRGGDGGGLAELFVPVTTGSGTNGLLITANKPGTPSNGISLVLNMDQLSNSVSVSGKKITVNRTGSTETVANLRTAINANASAGALVTASVRGSGSVGALTERFLYGGSGEEPVATVGGADAHITSYTDTTAVLEVTNNDFEAAGGADLKNALVQIIIGDRKISGQILVGYGQNLSTFRAALRAQGNIDLSAPGATMDSVTMVAGMRFWAPSQTAVTEDGLYVWNGAAVAATRAPEMPAGFAANGALISVGGGTNAGEIFQVTSAYGSDIVGTDGLADVTINV